MTGAEIARAGYDAYAVQTGGKTFDGRPMPTWDELPERIQQAWRAAALAIVMKAADIPLPIEGW